MLDDNIINEIQTRIREDRFQRYPFMTNRNKFIYILNGMVMSIGCNILRNTNKSCIVDIEKCIYTRKLLPLRDIFNKLISTNDIYVMFHSIYNRMTPKNIDRSRIILLSDYIELCDEYYRSREHHNYFNKKSNDNKNDLNNESVELTAEEFEDSRFVNCYDCTFNTTINIYLTEKDEKK